MFEDIDFGSGVVKTYFDMDISSSIPLEMQIDLLKEDMIQITYANDYLIDVGWYPEFDINGQFKVLLIKNYQWDIPVLSGNCRDIHLLGEYIQECIRIIHSTVLLLSDI